MDTVQQNTDNIQDKLKKVNYTTVVKVNRLDQ